MYTYIQAENIPNYESAESLHQPRREHTESTFNLSKFNVQYIHTKCTPISTLKMHVNI